MGLSPGTKVRGFRLAGTGKLGGMMLAVNWDTVRLFVHVLAATVWVGGQLTLAALVPTLRRLGAEVPRTAARRFNQVAWPAFAVLIVTGIWNVIAVRSQVTGSYETTLIVKLILVAVSGLTAALHARARTAAGLAVFGSLTGISALAALFVGIMLAELASH
jgi:putative copper export protein